MAIRLVLSPVFADSWDFEDDDVTSNEKADVKKVAGASPSSKSTTMRWCIVIIIYFFMGSGG